MVQRNNPAGRLWHILNEARDKPGDLTARDVLSDVLGASTDAQFFQRYAGLIELFAAVREGLAEVEDLDESLYGDHLANVERGFASKGFDAAWHHYIEDVDEATMVSLAYCSRELSRQHSESVIDSGQRRKLEKELERLASAISTSELDPVMKQVVARQLKEVQRAMAEYKLRGSSGVRHAVRATLASFITDGDQFKQESERGEVKQYWALLMRINALTKKHPSPRANGHHKVAYANAG